MHTLPSTSESEINKKNILSPILRHIKSVALAASVIIAPLAAQKGNAAENTNTTNSESVLVNSIAPDTNNIQPEWFTSLSAASTLVTSDPNFAAISPIGAESLPKLIKDLEQKIPQIQGEFSAWHKQVVAKVSPELEKVYGKLTQEFKTAPKKEDILAQQVKIQELQKKLAAPEVSPGDIQTAMNVCPHLNGWYQTEKSSMLRKMAQKYTGSLPDALKKVSGAAVNKRQPDLALKINALIVALETPFVDKPTKKDSDQSIAVLGPALSSDTPIKDALAPSFYTGKKSNWDVLTDGSDAEISHKNGSTVISFSKMKSNTSIRLTHSGSIDKKTRKEKKELVFEVPVTASNEALIHMVRIKLRSGEDLRGVRDGNSFKIVVPFEKISPDGSFQCSIELYSRGATEFDTPQTATLGHPIVIAR